MMPGPDSGCSFSCAFASSRLGYSSGWRGGRGSVDMWSRRERTPSLHCGQNAVVDGVG